MRKTLVPIKTAGFGKCAEAAHHHHSMITASLGYPRVKGRLGGEFDPVKTSG
jgi:hypothetical protein